VARATDGLEVVCAVRYGLCRVDADYKPVGWLRVCWGGMGLSL
jgi:hypothetical protein